MSPRLHQQKILSMLKGIKQYRTKIRSLYSHKTSGNTKAPMARIFEISSLEVGWLLLIWEWLKS